MIKIKEDIKKIKLKLKNLWDKEKSGNLKMEKIFKLAKKLLENLNLKDSELEEAILEIENYILFLAREEVNRELYQIVEIVHLNNFSSNDSKKVIDKVIVQKLKNIKEWLSKTDIDKTYEIRKWIDYFISENLQLN